MKITLRFITRILVYIISVLFLCEYLIYYIVIYQCSWPDLNPNNADASLPLKENPEPVRAMFLADTHLLGSRNGHWFDKLRREWQMHRAFQAAVNLHKPEVIFFLGDIFDEGLWCGSSEFNYYKARFHSLFKVSDGAKVHVVPGNHDIGFHYSISSYLHERFQAAFDALPVRMVTIRGNHFVLLNSMAMEGDGCFLCRSAEVKLMAIAEKLRCYQGIGNGCSWPLKSRPSYSRPIILQHFPMFRESDKNCDEPDEAPEDIKKLKFREQWECLSQEASSMLIEQLNPRSIFTGHTHHGCHVVHGVDIHEYTIPSFSWRNKDNPTFTLGLITPNNYEVSKCHMPRESTVILLYSVGVLGLIFWIVYNFYLLSSRRSHSLRLFKRC